MISFENLTVDFVSKTLFSKVSLQLKSGVKYGLVGANGAGKSTILRLIAENQKPTSGEIHVPKNAKIGFLEQNYTHLENQGILDVVLEGRADIWNLVKEQESLLSLECLSEKDIDRLSDIEESLQRLGGYEAEGQASSILQGLGFSSLQEKQPLKAFSGGYKIRVLLSKLLYSNPDILLLDEPTNYLDIESIAFLEEYIKRLSKTVVVSSHDRMFLNRISAYIIDIDFATMTVYEGNYEDFRHKKSLFIEQMGHKFDNLEKKQKHLEEFASKFGAKATKAKQAKSKMKQHERLEEEKQGFALSGSSRRAPFFQFGFKGRVPAVPLRVEKLSKSFGEKVVLEDVSIEFLRGDKVGIVGANGIGKSTLLKIIMGLYRSDSGGYFWKENVKVGYFPQEIDKEFVGDETVYSWLKNKRYGIEDQVIRSKLGHMLFSGDDADKKVSVLSGGEKVRLYFAYLSLEDYHVLVLDEPTNHLDLESCESLKSAVSSFKGNVILVTHDRYFLDGSVTKIMAISHKNIKVFDGSYADFVKTQTDYLERKLKKKNSKVQSNPKSKKTNSQDIEKAISKIEAKVDSVERKLKDLDLELASISANFSQIRSEKRDQTLKQRKNLEKELESLNAELLKLYDEL